MSRTMYDAVTVSDLPKTATLIAGYVDGQFANVNTMRQQFPNATIVDIAVFPTTNNGHVLDVETGDATPTQAPGWAKMRRSAGIDPTIYCNKSTWQAVQNAFTATGEPQPHYWIADWTGQPHSIPGAVACQYQAAGPYDVSEVADYWPGIDLAPKRSGETRMNVSFEIGPNGGGVTFARGTCNNVALFVDNTLYLGNADLGVDLRVVQWVSDSGPIVEIVRVSNAKGNQTVVTFKKPEMTHSVTITRADKSTVTVYGEVS